MLNLKGDLNKQIKTSLIGGMDKAKTFEVLPISLLKKMRLKPNKRPKPNIRPKQLMPQRITRSKAKALGDEHQLMSLFVISLE